MVIIVFPSGNDDWFKTNWCYRQLAQDAAAAFPNDAQLKHKLEMGAAFGSLFLDKMDPEMAQTTIKALKRAAEETIARKIPGWKAAKMDNQTRQYLDALRELLDLIREEESK